MGIVDDRLAVPVRLTADPKLKEFFDTSVADLLLGTQVDTRDYILPTAAYFADSVVGDCCSCEDTVVEREKLELERMRAENRLIDLEGQRLQARLHVNLLSEDRPDPVRFEVVLRRALGSDTDAS